MWYILSIFSSSKCSLFHKSNVFGSCIIHILYTGCAKIKKNNSGAKRLIHTLNQLYPLQPSQPISLKSSLILFSHLCLNIPSPYLSFRKMWNSHGGVFQDLTLWHHIIENSNVNFPSGLLNCALIYHVIMHPTWAALHKPDLINIR